ncbi:hypothetical protein LMG18090_01288 [Ralstonia mannitolilytica]|uniref:hypothetical protein n=1 Tax=Ralstonia mannitolilytica TaxID=105219 RepID=UPI0028F65BD9|nr:hypothetical protein [Ralstonia mannitolilytica]CAJ0781198.1 hypothetical protein LMG18090_01288 [Ralstonia mannitolilytica]
MSRNHRGQSLGNPVTRSLPAPAGGVQLETFVPWTLVKRGSKKQVITPLNAPQEFVVEAKQAGDSTHDTPLMRALGLAHYWQRLLDDQRFDSLTQIAAAEGMDLGQVSKIARLAYLAPAVIEACLADDSDIVLEHVVRMGRFPLNWQMQGRKLVHRKSSRLTSPDGTFGARV